MEIAFANHPVLYSIILVIPFALLIVWCMAGFLALKHAPLMEDVPPPKTPAGLRPEEAERPALIPHKLDPVTPDRPDPLYFASSADKIAFAIAAARARRKMDAMEWDRKVAEDIEDILGDVREGDTRG